MTTVNSATPDARPPANFDEDVSADDVLEAERLVLEYLRAARGFSVIDWRAEHLGWDFEVSPEPGRVLRVDVKADRFIDTTARLPFETRHVFRNGDNLPGWGTAGHIDVVAVVGVDSGRCVFASVPALRGMVEAAELAAPQTRGAMPAGWRPFKRENARGGYVTHGWAIPLSHAWREDAIRQVVYLPGGEL